MTRRAPDVQAPGSLLATWAARTRPRQRFWQALAARFYAACDTREPTRDYLEGADRKALLYRHLPDLLDRVVRNPGMPPLVLILTHQGYLYPARRGGPGMPGPPITGEVYDAMSEAYAQAFAESGVPPEVCDELARDLAEHRAAAITPPNHRALHPYLRQRWYGGAPTLVG